MQGRRLKTAYYRAGEGNERKLLLVHGNVSSSAFYLPLFPELSKVFDVVAPDMRCFGDSDALPVDAKRGYGDWCDDLDEFVELLGWKKFIFVGWSLGGEVAMQYTIEHADKLERTVLVCPGSPFGFGGTKDVQGTMLEPAGLGSGAGCVNAATVQALVSGDREAMRNSLNNVIFKPGFKLEPEMEELFIDEMLKTKVGDGMYPGNFTLTQEWPTVVAGDMGICNTMSPVWGNLSRLADIPIKPDILWVRGQDDIFVSDTSLGDFGYLGQLGMVPGWPGAEAYPPQPMISQTRYVLDKYAANGGKYEELVVPGGHGCIDESPEEFCKALIG